MAMGMATRIVVPAAVAQDAVRAAADQGIPT